MTGHDFMWPIRGLYGITSGASSAAELAERAAAWIPCGARVVQYHDKNTDGAPSGRGAGALRRMSSDWRTAFDQ